MENLTNQINKIFNKYYIFFLIGSFLGIMCSVLGAWILPFIEIEFTQAEEVIILITLFHFGVSLGIWGWGKYSKLEGSMILALILGGFAGSIFLFFGVVTPTLGINIVVYVVISTIFGIFGYRLQDAILMAWRKIRK